MCGYLTVMLFNRNVSYLIDQKSKNEIKKVY
jgi:hypothetical protein